jgi:Putative amidoligase enzyme
MNVQLTINETAKLSVLSQEQIRERIEGTPQRIPADVRTELETFINGQNRTAAQRLLTAINAFANPEEGFRVWQEYYNTGDQPALRQAILTRKFSLASQARVINQEIAALPKKRGPIRRASKTAAILALTHTVFREVDHMDTSTGLIFHAFESARHLAFHPDIENPLLFALKTELQSAVREKLASSLDSLRGATAQPLVDERIIRSKEAEVISATQDRFSRIAMQSFHAKNDRLPLTIGKGHIPNGLRFRIELEGHMPSDQDARKQVITLTTALRTLDIPFAFSIGAPETDSKYAKWRVVSALSVVNPLRHAIAGDGNSIVQSSGLRIVSAILEGESGSEQARRIINLLQRIGFTTNESCEFRILVDLSSASLDEVKKVAKAFVRNEADIDKLIESGRRGQTSGGFAKSVASVAIQDIDSAQNLEELVRVMSGGNRNTKFDITSLPMAGAAPTVQYLGEGGQAYLKGAHSYMTVMLNFTEQAKTNPDVKLTNVINGLREDREIAASETAIVVDSIRRKSQSRMRH